MATYIRRVLAAAAWLAGAAPAAAQSASDLMAAGDRESAARRPAAALASYERALQADPKSAQLLWRVAREAVDLGEFEQDTRRRTTLYTQATDHARRALAIAPSDPEAHFHLARALGRTALALGPRERVKLAVEVRDHALETLRLNPRHAGAAHVMGVWHAEVMRLNGMARAVARAFLGGQVFASASWREAIRYMEQSVTIEPERMVHRLDLARVYRDADRPADARTAYEAALKSALLDANDETYRQHAESELRRLR